MKGERQKMAVFEGYLTGRVEGEGTGHWPQWWLQHMALRLDKLEGRQEDP